MFRQPRQTTLRLFDSGAADGLLYYVMPYVEGETLRHRLDRYAAHPDGMEFAVSREASEGVKLVVVTNWLDEVMPKSKGAKGP